MYGEEVDQEKRGMSVMYEILVRENGKELKRFNIEKEETIFRVSEVQVVEGDDVIFKKVGFVKHKENEGLLKLVAKALLRGWGKEYSCGK